MTVCSACDTVVNDVWMYVTVLWNTRPETVDRLVHAIDTASFDAILVSPGVLSPANNPGDTPWSRIIYAVFRHYAVTFRGAEVNVLTRQDVRLQPRLTHDPGTS